MPDLTRVVVSLVLSALVSSSVEAQCSMQWSAGSGGAGLLVTLSNGDVVSGGSGVVRYDGSTWQPVGSGVSGVVDIAELPNGDLVVAGGFSSGVGRWDGSAWSALPAPLTGMTVFEVAALPNGDIAALGRFTPNPSTYTTYVELWNGSSWRIIGTAYGSPGIVPFSTPIGLDTLPSGELVALGDWLGMSPAGNQGGHNELVRWDGMAWHRLGDMPDPTALLVAEAGQVYVGSATGVLGYDSVTGQQILMGGGGGVDVKALSALPDGDVVAGGGFTGAFFPPIGLRRWDGTAWSTMGFGTNAQNITALAMHGSGQLLVFGSFAAAGGVATPTGRAVLATLCPALAVPVATACVGPAGPITLVAAELPWVGSTFRSTATGFAANALGLALVGWNPQQTALVALHPSALPNCDLLVTIEAWVPTFPVAGVSEYALAIPNDPVLAGVTLSHQFLQGELSPQFVLQSLSSSNALTLTVGVF